MKHLRYLVVALTLLLPRAAAAQVADTIFVSITAPFDTVIVAGPDTLHTIIGDTVSLIPIALDVEGDTIPDPALQFTWFTDSPDAIEVVTNPDGTGYGVVLHKAPGIEHVKIWVLAEPISELLMGELVSPDSIAWREANIHCLVSLAPDNKCLYGPPGHEREPDTSQQCAYVLHEGYLVAESPGPPICPSLFEPRPGTNATSRAFLTVVPRQRPIEHIAFLADRLAKLAN